MGKNKDPLLNLFIQVVLISVIVFLTSGLTFYLLTAIGSYDSIVWTKLQVLLPSLVFNYLTLFWKKKRSSFEGYGIAFLSTLTLVLADVYVFAFD